VVEKVRTVLVDQDDALRRACEDLENVRTLASTWEAEVATASVQLQQGRAALQEAERLRIALADKTTALATAEEQLWQERAASQEAEGQLQREQAALIEARAALEQQWMAREEVLGRLQQKEEEESCLNGELVQLSISHEDQRQSLKEQGASFLKLQQEAEETRRSLEVEKKQVKGEFVSIRFLFVDSFFWDPLPTSSFFLFVASRPTDRAGARNHPGRDTADGLQLLSTRVGGAAGRHSRDLPGGRGRRGTSWELAGKPLARSWWACLEADAPRSSPGRQEGPRCGEVSL
jgi:hypothetical protein